LSARIDATTAGGGAGESGVSSCAGIEPGAIAGLASRFGLEVVVVASGNAIPGSYWGAPEAGLVGNRLFIRGDTPVHSLLHELAHFVCMEPSRRRRLDTDAGGDDREECAACYLEVLLAAHLSPYDPASCLADMDGWGYSFREGSAASWFRGDGLEARDWLATEGLIDTACRPTWRLRGQSFVGFGASP
jgi:hypothetical protein